MSDTSRTIPQADIETLRVIYGAVSRGDWDAAAVHVHPDFEWVTSSRVPLAGTYRTPAEVQRFFDEEWEAFDEVTVEPEEFFERGDQIVVFARTRFHPAGSTAAVENRTGHLWTMRDGVAVRCEVFAHREHALEAAGLRGPGPQ